MNPFATIDARLPAARGARMRKVERDINGNIVGGEDVLSGDRLQRGGDRGNMSTGGMAWLDAQKAKREQRAADAAPLPATNPYANADRPLPAARLPIPSGAATSAGVFNPALGVAMQNVANVRDMAANRLTAPAGAPVLNDSPLKQAVTRAPGGNPFAQDPRAAGIRAQLVGEGRIDADGRVPQRSAAQPGQDSHGVDYLNRLASNYQTQADARYQSRTAGTPLDASRQGDDYAKRQAEIVPAPSGNPFAQVSRAANGSATIAGTYGTGSSRPDNGIASAGAGIYDESGKQVSASRSTNPFASTGGKPPMLTGANEDEEARRKRTGGTNPFATTALA